MNEQELLDLAKRIRDGQATKQEKINFLQELRLGLEEVSKILNQAKKGK